MDFQEITLTIDGYVYLRWITANATWESWIDPEYLVDFVKELMRI